MTAENDQQQRGADVVGPPPAPPASGAASEPGAATAAGQPVAPAAPAADRLDPRHAVTAVLGLLTVALMAAVSMLPVPYAVVRPGPVRDVLGTHGGAPMIAVEGERTYPTDGRLDLLTVSVDGGPGSPVNLAELVSGVLDPDVSVRPRDELFPPDVTRESIEQESNQEMVTSQEQATAAALHELDVPVPTTLTVAGFSPDAPAEDVLREGDVVVAVGGQQVTDLPQLRDVLQRSEPGDDVVVGVVRDGATVPVTVTTTGSEDGRTLLGVLVDPTYEFPFDVRISIENIGGPSAGMVFALGIIDKLTPGALTGGEHVAGTGTVDSDGTVGPIGGVQQKLVAARDAGAEWFLAPAGNCPEVVGHVPDGLRVVEVETLEQARAAVEAIGAGQGTRDLPTCD
ncbi:YlbL family protein [Thalassiella azotivora]